MPATALPVAVPAADLAAWITRITRLRDDVAFGLDPRGVTAQLADLLAAIQDTRRDNP